VFFVNLAISASIISLSVWLAEKSPNLAGFIVSLPISTLLVLALNQIQHGNAGNSVALAKSIFLAIPLTLVFFIPFLMSERWKLSFWTCYISGIVLLFGAYLAHRYLFSAISKG
jgi:hypothetical protein